MSRLARGKRCQVLFCDKALGNQNQGKKVPDTFRSADRARTKENSIVSPDFRVTKAAYDVNGDGNADGQNALESDMIAAKDRIKTLTGIDTKYVRPPYGSHNAACDQVYQRQGLKIVLWDIEGDGWEGNRNPTPQQVRDHLKQEIKAKIAANKKEVIVLFHDRKERTADNLADYIQAMKDGAKEVGAEDILPSTQHQVDGILDRR